MTFQFHKGTIRTYLVNIQPQGVAYFNSIKVRLEHRQELEVDELTI